MGYKRQNFVNKETVLYAEHLQHIENGIIENESQIGVLRNTVEENMSTVDKDIKELNDNITSLENDITKDINTLNESVKTLETSINNLGGTTEYIEAINKDIEEIKTSISTIGTSVTTLSENTTESVNKINGDVKTLGDNLTTLSQTTTQNIGNINTKITGVESSITALETSTTEDINKLDKDVEDLGKSLTTLQSNTTGSINTINTNVTNLNTSVNTLRTETESAMTSLGKSVADGKTLLATSISRHITVANDATFEQLNTAMQQAFEDIGSSYYTDGHREGYDEGYYDGEVSAKPVDAQLTLNISAMEMTPSTSTTKTLFEGFSDIAFKSHYILIIRMDDTIFHEEKAIFSNLGFSDTSFNAVSGASDKVSVFYEGTPNSLHDFKIKLTSSSNPGMFDCVLKAYFITWDNDINFKELDILI